MGADKLLKAVGADMRSGDPRVQKLVIIKMIGKITGKTSARIEKFFAGWRKKTKSVVAASRRRLTRPLPGIAGVWEDFRWHDFRCCTFCLENEDRTPPVAYSMKVSGRTVTMGLSDYNHVCILKPNGRWRHREPTVGLTLTPAEKKAVRELRNTVIRVWKCNSGALPSEGGDYRTAGASGNDSLCGTQTYLVGDLDGPGLTMCIGFPDKSSSYCLWKPHPSRKGLKGTFLGHFARQTLSPNSLEKVNGLRRKLELPDWV